MENARIIPELITILYVIGTEKYGTGGRKQKPEGTERERVGRAAQKPTEKVLTNCRISNIMQKEA